MKALLGVQSKLIFYESLWFSRLRLSIWYHGGNWFSMSVHKLGQVLHYFCDILNYDKWLFSWEKIATQVNPISPYLFLLFMENFAATFQGMTTKRAFTYHPMCQILKLPQLDFANDLFLLCRADKKSFTVISSAFKEFHSFSSYKPDKQRSVVFFTGVDACVKKDTWRPFPSQALGGHSCF